MKETRNGEGRNEDEEDERERAGWRASRQLNSIWNLRMQCEIFKLNLF